MTRRVRTKRGSSGSGGRDFPRTARVNQLLREIIAEQLEVLDDDRLVMVTITAVETETDLARAVVFYDSLQGAEGDAEVLAAFNEIRFKLQGAIGREARIRNTPVLSFRPDSGVRAGAHIEELLSTIDIVEGDVPVPDAEARAADAAARAAAEAAQAAAGDGVDGVDGVDPGLDAADEA